MLLSVQMQLNIVAGTLGVVIIILIISLIVFHCMFCRVQEKIGNLALGKSGSHPNQVNILPGEELHQRGFLPKLRSTNNIIYGISRGSNAPPSPPVDYAMTDATIDFMLKKKNSPDNDDYRLKQLNAKNVSATIQILDDRNPHHHPQYNNSLRSVQFDTYMRPCFGGYSDNERQLHNNNEMQC